MDETDDDKLKDQRENRGNHATRFIVRPSVSSASHDQISTSFKTDFNNNDSHELMSAFNVDEINSFVSSERFKKMIDKRGKNYFEQMERMF